MNHLALKIQLPSFLHRLIVGILVWGGMVGNSTSLLAQGEQQEAERIEAISALLDSLSSSIPGLLDTANLSFQNILLHDFVRVLGKTYQVNLFIEDTPGKLLSNTFQQEPVKSVILFICSQFQYEIKPIGNILNFLPYSLPPPPDPPRLAKPLRITFDANGLGFDLQNDSIEAVIRKVSQLSGKILLPEPNVTGKISGFIPPSDFEVALGGILKMNGFEMRERGGIYYVSVAPADQPSNQAARNGNGRNPSRPNPGPRTTPSGEVEISQINRLFSLKAYNASLETVVKQLFEEAGVDYFIYDPIEGEITTEVQDFTLPEILEYLFQGTESMFKIEASGTYQIGSRFREGLWQSQIVSLRYRPSTQVQELIPDKLKEGLDIREYVELNRMIISGDPKRAAELVDFIREIDRPIPMVKIEMLVIDVNTTSFLEAGIKAGLSQAGDSLGGQKEVLPGINYTLDGGEINQILNTTNIPFLDNIGPLRQNFYLQVQAQEARGNIKVITRPVISTLNGIEASFTIGETQYFKLLTNIAANAAINPITQVTETLQPIQYNTTLIITPYISADNIVTLDITPNFTTPGAQSDPTIPPNVLTREFSSTIRVRNGESVVLGGLSRDATTKNSEGVPFLSRIPVLKWLFGTNSKGKTNSSLIIYITPTIYYN